MFSKGRQLPGLMSALALDDRVNPEAAGNIRAAAAEDTVLGLMLLYEEHRRAVREGAVSLTADDFVTAFNRRVFEAIMELENSDGGFSTAVLGEKFDPEKHNAVMHTEDETAAENTVVEVFQKGYTLGDKILRFAMVKVAN